MFKIQTLNVISPIGLNQFPRDLYEVASQIKDPDAILVRSQDMHHMIIPDSVKVIGRAGSGVSNIPVDQLTDRGIPVFNTPGANANAVRELVIAGMLLASRNLYPAMEYVNTLKNGELEHKIEKNKSQFTGFELMGKTLGVVGLGSVGVKVANAAMHLGMNVIGYDPTITINRAWELSANVKQAYTLEHLLSQSDFVSFHVPLNEFTKHMINFPLIELMKHNIILLNFSRGGIVDHQALLSALNENHILAYVTDFPNSILKNHPKVVCFPHLGASTKEAEENCAMMIAKQVRGFLESGSIIHSVNFPLIHIGRLKTGTRLLIVNANIPNIIAQISKKLANAGHNIQSLMNQSLENIAYTVIDLEEDIDQKLCKKITSIEGVKQIRIVTNKSPV